MGTTRPAFEDGGIHWPGSRDAAGWRHGPGEGAWRGSLHCHVVWPPLCHHDRLPLSPLCPVHEAQGLHALEPPHCPVCCWVLWCVPRDGACADVALCCGVGGSDSGDERVCGGVYEDCAWLFHPRVYHVLPCCVDVQPEGHVAAGAPLPGPDCILDLPVHREGVLLWDCAVCTGVFCALDRGLVAVWVVFRVADDYLLIYSYYANLPRSYTHLPLISQVILFVGVGTMAFWLNPYWLKVKATNAINWSPEENKNFRKRE